MIRLQVLNLLEKALNQKGKMINNDNVDFWCPVCNREFNKKKLTVCLNDESKKFGWWRCWICKDENGMSGRNLIKLLKKINADKKYLYDLSQIIHVPYKDPDNLFDKQTKSINIIELPNEFIPINKKSKAYDYIKRRGISDTEIMRYNIGYCEKGKYANRVIIPSYDVNGTLNYFIARSYEENWFPKYKNPPIPNNEYVIFFDIFINWEMPITLVEGVFDAIAAKRNAIPLLGQSITTALQNKLLSRDVNSIIIALDKDAIKTSLKYTEKFISEGIDVKFMNIKQKDPSEMGFREFMSLYDSLSNVDFENLIKLKMEF
jgi:hypothetical protein